MRSGSTHAIRRARGSSGAVAAGALCLAGCYATHVRGGSSASDASVDATARADTRAVDAPSSPIDSPLPASCGARPLDVACTDTGTGYVPVGQPYELPVYFGHGHGCFCGEELRCTASVVGSELHLESAMCAELLCDGCFPFVEGRCALPPMAEGVYRVRVNGVESFELVVSDATPITGPVDACVRTPLDTFSCGFAYDPAMLPPDEVCHDAVARAGQPIPVEVRSFCMPCGAFWGPCVVTRTAGEIFVFSQHQQSLCDIDCTDECSESVGTCEIPPLPPGEYTVRGDGLGTTQLVVTDGELRPGRACASRPED
jgi:hypothetical protein